MRYLQYLIKPLERIGCLTWFQKLEFPFFYFSFLKGKWRDMVNLERMGILKIDYICLYHIRLYIFNFFQVLICIVFFSLYWNSWSMRSVSFSCVLSWLLESVTWQSQNLLIVDFLFLCCGNFLSFVELLLLLLLLLLNILIVHFIAETFFDVPDYCHH